MVDWYGRRLADLSGLNRVRDGGRDPRQDLGPEWRCARRVRRPWRDGCSGPVSAHQSSGIVMVSQPLPLDLQSGGLVAGLQIQPEQMADELRRRRKMKVVLRIVGILLLVVGLV
jgi:hypothetical protein